MFDEQVVFRRSRRPHTAFALLGALASIAACKDGKDAIHGERGPSVVIEGTTMDVGFSLSKRKAISEVPSFRISETPVTVSEYKRCVDSTACTPPASKALSCATNAAVPILGPTYSIEGGGQLPISCLTPEQAGEYCAFVRGALPTTEQWLLAARGPRVQEYAWGAAPADCEMHPSARGCSQETADYEVRKHKKGMAASGMHDALLTPRELLRSDPGSVHQACRSPNGFCTVNATSPGEIGMASPYRPGDQDSREPTVSFRCVWEK